MLIRNENINEEAERRAYDNGYELDRGGSVIGLGGSLRRRAITGSKAGNNKNRCFNLGGLTKYEPTIERTYICRQTN